MKADEKKAVTIQQLEGLLEGNVKTFDGKTFYWWQRGGKFINQVFTKGKAISKELFNKIIEIAGGNHQVIEVDEIPAASILPVDGVTPPLIFTVDTRNEPISYNNASEPEKMQAIQVVEKPTPPPPPPPPEERLSFRSLMENATWVYAD